jgi:hypothetical protein
MIDKFAVGQKRHVFHKSGILQEAIPDNSENPDCIQFTRQHAQH